tara:strand:- start:2219 stop:6856 length:4638 start_codon:yes stop_codon:yes gene_type:complete
MAKACVLKNKRTGKIERVSAANGKESKLYNKLKNLLGNEEMALLAWAKTYTEDFKNWFGDSKAVDSNGEPLLLYLDKTNTDNNVFRFTEEKNNQPVFINAIPSSIVNNKFEIINNQDIKPLLNVAPELKEINYNIIEGNEIYEKIAFKTKDAHSRLKDYKNTQKNILRNRLAKIKEQRKSIEKLEPKNQKEKDVYKAKLQSLFKLEAEVLKAIEQISEEIFKLKKNTTLKSLYSIANADFNRIEYLLNKPGIRTPLELNEINQIIDFYFNMKMEKDNIKNHSIYGRDLMASGIYDQLPKDEIDLYNELYNKANQYRNQVDLIERKRVEKIVNENTKVQNVYNEKFTYEQLTKPLVDTSWVDMMVMDITMGIFSENGIIPQVALDYIENFISKENVQSREEVALIEKLADKAKSLLGTVNSSGISFSKRQATDWSIFKQKDEFGNNTGNLIYRYSTKFFNDRSIMEDEYQRKIDEIRGIDNIGIKDQLIIKANEFRKQWYKKNTIQINPGMIPEIIEEYKDNPLFETETDQAKIAAHVKELKDNLGENGYKEEVAKQKKLFKRFVLASESFKDMLTEEDYNNYVLANSPFTGIKYAQAVGNPYNVLPTMEYNITIPRKEINGKDTGYYDSNFKKIDEKAELYEFYRNMMDILKSIKEGFPVELQDKLNVNSIPAFKKTYNEVVIDSTNTTDKFSKAKASLTQKVADNFTSGIENEISFASINYITGKTNYEVNASFLDQNQGKIQDMTNVEYQLFKTEYEINGAKLKDGKISLSSLNASSLRVIADALDMDAVDVNAIRMRIGDSFSPKVFFKSVATHRLAQDKSFDLPRVLKMYSQLAARYRASSNAKPYIDLLKTHYERIKLKATTDTGKAKKLLKGGVSEDENLDQLRKNAQRQFEDWYKRVVLLNFSEAKGVDLTTVENASRDFTGDERSFFKKFLDFINPTSVKRVLSEEEKRFAKSLQKLIAKETDPKKKEEYTKKINELGKSYTAFSLMNGVLNAIRIKGLGWNLSSSITNLMEGEAANLIIAAQGDYFSQDSYWRARAITRKSFGKNITAGKLKIPDAIKLRNLMDKTDILQDSANELQRSSDVSSFGKNVSKLHPLELNRRTEYLIQSPIFVSMLLEQTITDSNGENPSSVWDAMDENGNLRPPYNTEQNIATWQDMNNAEFNNFRSRVSAAINLAHGNYSNLRGMLAKSSAPGKAVLMFKTWLPNAIYSRFAIPQDNLLGGVKNYKGRYHSFTGPSAAMFGSVLGYGMGGPMLALGGFAASYIWRSKSMATMKKYGITQPKTELNYMKELAFSTKMLLLKSMGMPIKRIFGKELKFLKENTPDYKSLVSETFSETDAKNMNANITELALALQKLALMLIVAGFFYDDDDDEDDPRRKTYNVLMNRLNQLYNGVTQYSVNMLEFARTSKPILVSQIEDTTKFISSLQEYYNDNDIYTTGTYRGESKTNRAFSKAFLPGILKDPLSLGFSAQYEQLYDKAGFHKYLKEGIYEESQDETRRKLKQLKAREKLRLLKIHGKEKEKAINKYLNKKYPLPKT